MEEAALLVPVQRVIGGVEIERDLLRRPAARIEEQPDEQRLDRRGVGGELAGECRQHRVVAQLVVVDQILIAERDPDHPPHHQRRDLVLDQGGITVIAHPGSASGSVGSLAASTKRRTSSAEARFALAVLTTERKAA